MSPSFLPCIPPYPYYHRRGVAITAFPHQVFSLVRWKETFAPLGIEFRAGSLSLSQSLSSSLILPSGKGTPFSSSSLLSHYECENQERPTEVVSER